jgi:hypothetical protein
VAENCDAWNRNQVQTMIDDTRLAMGSSTWKVGIYHLSNCHRKTHSFLQAAFFNKDAMRKKIFSVDSSFS